MNNPLIQNIKIFINTSFRYLHKFKSAPEDVYYLRNLHRHTFNVNVELDVEHEDRDIEFFMFQTAIDKICSKYIEEDQQKETPYLCSCESIARYITENIFTTATDESNVYRNFKITVSEDGENGGIVSGVGVISKEFWKLYDNN